jgi:hypothetical protein
MFCAQLNAVSLHLAKELELPCGESAANTATIATNINATTTVAIYLTVFSCFFTGIFSCLACLACLFAMGSLNYLEIAGIKT